MKRVEDGAGFNFPAANPSNRYNQGGELVPAPARDRPVAYPIHQETSALGDTHLAALETIQERSGPFERAIGLVIRVLPWSILWAGLGAGGMVLFDSDWPLPFFGFVILTAITYFLLNGQEYKHSAAGLERHKADLAHDLQSQKLANDHDLAKTALAAYIRYLEGKP